MEKVDKYIVPKEQLRGGICEKIIYGEREADKPERSLNFAVRQNKYLSNGQPYNRYWGE